MGTIGNWKYVILSVLIVLNVTVHAQQKKGPFYQTSISLGPVLSLYGYNKKHTSGMKSGAAFTASVKGNFRITRSASLNTGVTYLVHSNTFNSYYFPDSTLRLYDSKHTYSYESRFQDIIIPFSIKIKLANKKQKESSFYTELGWGLRKRLSSNLQVNSILYGASAYDGSAGNEFKTRYVSKRSAGSLLLSLGFDKDFKDRNAGFFIVATYNRSTNKFYYSGGRGFPGDLFLVESFISLSGGFRF